MAGSALAGVRHVEIAHDSSSGCCRRVSRVRWFHPTVRFCRTFVRHHVLKDREGITEEENKGETMLIALVPVLVFWGSYNRIP